MIRIVSIYERVFSSSFCARSILSRPITEFHFTLLKSGCFVTVAPLRFHIFMFIKVNIEHFISHSRLILLFNLVHIFFKSVLVYIFNGIININCFILSAIFPRFLHSASLLQTCFFCWDLCTMEPSPTLSALLATFLFQLFESFAVLFLSRSKFDPLLFDINVHVIYKLMVNWRSFFRI